MNWIVIVFLFLSFLLYLILGGADFGAGVLELFTRPKNRGSSRSLTYKAIGPVWEANHIWLILIVVILFMAYPAIFSLISIHLHIPILLVLLGIIFRGTSFVFRHYDAEKGGDNVWYDRIFVWSSFLTPLFLGVTAGAAVSGRIDPEATGFAGGFLAPWLHPFAFAVGLFTVSICAWLAAVFLTGETSAPDQVRRYQFKAKAAAITNVLSGIAVFGTGWLENIPVIRSFPDFVPGLIAVALATAVFPLVWSWVGKGRTAQVRILAAGQVVLVTGAVFMAVFPNLLVVEGGELYSLLSPGAPEATIRVLGWALIFGGSLIIPALIYLMRVFKG